MNAIKHKTAKRQTAKHISAVVLYAAVSFICTVFGAFFLFGSDVSSGYMLSPAAMILADIVIFTIYLFTAATAATAAWSMAKSMKNGTGVISKENLIPAARIKKITAVFVVSCLAITFIAASDKPVNINGTAFTDTLWLKITDMFIFSVTALLAAAAGCLFYGMSGNIRKRK